MRINRLLWGLWGAMIISMLLHQRADTYMIVALIILPILIVLLDLHEEINLLKEENKHQRKFVMDRYNLMQEKFNDVTSQIEKRLVVDFAEFAKSNPGEERTPQNRAEMPRANRKKKKKMRPAAQAPVDFHDMKNETMAGVTPENKPEEDFDDI
ncbi:MAG: hypothetical protein AB1403_22295 [Candidatus Riflebacteria bacterium]